jgi:hypothetical protein
MKKDMQNDKKSTKNNKNYELASSIMPKGERVEATLMHTDRFKQ